MAGTCNAPGHEGTNPARHPRWGLVPSASSTVLGSLIVLAILGVWWWVWPGVYPAVATGVVLLGGLFSGVIQFALGHRGVCWWQRTIRWWFGPVGTLLDPLDAG